MYDLTLYLNSFFLRHILSSKSTLIKNSLSFKVLMSMNVGTQVNPKYGGFLNNDIDLRCNFN